MGAAGQRRLPGRGGCVELISTGAAPWPRACSESAPTGPTPTSSPATRWRRRTTTEPRQGLRRPRGRRLPIRPARGSVQGIGRVPRRRVPRRPRRRTSGPSPARPIGNASDQRMQDRARGKSRGKKREVPQMPGIKATGRRRHKADAAWMSQDRDDARSARRRDDEHADPERCRRFWPPWPPACWLWRSSPRPPRRARRSNHSRPRPRTRRRRASRSLDLVHVCRSPGVPEAARNVIFNAPRESSATPTRSPTAPRPTSPWISARPTPRPA